MGRALLLQAHLNADVESTLKEEAQDGEPRWEGSDNG